jgi:hypothetical protein
MRILLAMVLVFQCTRCVSAEPLTVKEITLMLHCGYSSETVLRVLSNRHFAGDLNPAAEKELTNVNASPSLIDALKSGNYSASSQEMARARELASAQKVWVQKTIAAQEDASRQIAPQQSRNTRIIVAPAPAGDSAARWANSGPPSALDRQNAAMSASFEREFDHRTQAEKQEAARAARENWCREHPVECAQMEEKEAMARREEEKKRAEEEKEDAERAKRVRDLESQAQQARYNVDSARSSLESSRGYYDTLAAKTNLENSERDARRAEENADQAHIEQLSKTPIKDSLLSPVDVFP